MGTNPKIIRSIRTSSASSVAGYSGNSGTFPCAICGAVLRTSAGLKKHYIIRHVGVVMSGGRRIKFRYPRSSS